MEMASLRFGNVLNFKSVDKKTVEYFVDKVFENTENNEVFVSFLGMLEYIKVERKTYYENKNVYMDVFKKIKKIQDSMKDVKHFSIVKIGDDCDKNVESTKQAFIKQKSDVLVLVDNNFNSIKQINKADYFRNGRELLDEISQISKIKTKKVK